MERRQYAAAVLGAVSECVRLQTTTSLSVTAACAAKPETARLATAFASWQGYVEVSCLVEGPARAACMPSAGSVMWQEAAQY